MIVMKLLLPLRSTSFMLYGSTNDRACKRCSQTFVDKKYNFSFQVTMWISSVNKMYCFTGFVDIPCLALTARFEYQSRPLHNDMVKHRASTFSRSFSVISKVLQTISFHLRWHVTLASSLLGNMAESKYATWSVEKQAQLFLQSFSKAVSLSRDEHSLLTTTSVFLLLPLTMRIIVSVSSLSGILRNESAMICTLKQSQERMAKATCKFWSAQWIRLG